MMDNNSLLDSKTNYIDTFRVREEVEVRNKANSLLVTIGNRNLIINCEIYETLIPVGYQSVGGQGEEDLRS